MFKFNLYVFNKRSDVKKTQLEEQHFFSFFLFFFLFTLWQESRENLDPYQPL